MTRRRTIGAALTAVLVLASRAAADPAPAIAGAEHVDSPSTVKTDGGSSLRLPAGYFLDESTYSRLDVEMRRLQAAEVELTVQNKVLRSDASGWQPGWKAIATTLITGVTLGWYLREKL